MTALRQSVPSSLSLFAILTAGLILLPLGYIAGLAIASPAAVWNRLWHTRIPELLSNTVALAGAVAAVTLLLGLSLAWIVVRFDFWGRRFWEWALVLPLTIPSYVLAYVFTYWVGTGGPIERLWQRWFGPEAQLFSPYSFAGATLVMALDTFPFVYLLTRAALMNFNVSYEEVARVCGASRQSVLFRITLPLLRPALVAGLSLVVLYVVSDFGAVSLLRYQTFTYAVYQQLTGRYDPAAAAVLSLLLVIFAVICLAVERWFRHRSRFYQTTGRYRAPARKSCDPLGTILITGYLAAVLALAFGVPVGSLLAWTGSAVAAGAVDSRFLGFVWNSTALSGVAATAAVGLGVPLVYLATRRSSPLTTWCLQAAYAGYVLPGPVGALAVLTLFTHLAPFWYGTALVLVVAYIIHFLPAGLQAMESVLHQVTPNLEEAARSLGFGPWRTLGKVTLPLVRGGILVAWVLVFLQCIKELPATLLLRPVGFDTLAVRVWLEASEEYYQLAAPAALLIVAITLPALLLIAQDQRAA